MLSNGGVIGAATAALQPVRMIESGPAAGALAASLLSKTYGVSDLISFDMGGTTAKACLIQGGEPLITGEFECRPAIQVQAGQWHANHRTHRRHD